MPSVNELISDELLAHAIGLDRYGNGVAHRMVLHLNQVDSGLRAALSDALASAGSFGVRNDVLQARLAGVRRINAAAYQAVLAPLLVEIRSFIAYEIEFQEALFSKAIPADVLALVPLERVSAEEVFAGAMTKTFRGAGLREWMAGAERNRMAAITSAISTGYVLGKSTEEVLSDIGGQTVKRTDGKLEKARRDLASIVRTALAYAGAVVRGTFYQANAGLISAEQWVAVLDNRTSPMCRLRDGKRYTLGDHRPIGHDIPWRQGPGKLHCHCRSHSEPIFKNFDTLGLSLGVIGQGVRESMNGEFPARLTYLDWLNRQSPARQDEILGPTRGRLHREGGMRLEEMYSSQGDFLTLDQLRARDAAAFRRAGL